MFKLFHSQDKTPEEAEEREKEKEQKKKDKELKKKEREEKKREKELLKERRRSLASPEPNRDGESSSARKLETQTRVEESPFKLRNSSSSTTPGASKAESSPENSAVVSVQSPTTPAIASTDVTQTVQTPAQEVATSVEPISVEATKITETQYTQSAETQPPVEPKKDIIKQVTEKALQNLQPKPAVVISKSFLDHVQLQFLVPTVFGFGILVVYVMGYVGIPFWTVLILMWNLQKIDNLRQEREWKAKYQMLENERIRKEREVTLRHK